MIDYFCYIVLMKYILLVSIFLNILLLLPIHIFEFNFVISIVFQSSP